MADIFIKIVFTSDCLYIGERIKKGTFKPSISPQGLRFKRGGIISGILPLPYSTATGALRSILGWGSEIHAIGIMKRYEVEYMTIAPYDNALSSAKLPITVEYLRDIEGEIYIEKTQALPSLQPLEPGFIMGGMKSKGFGTCKVKSITEYKPKVIPQAGRFISRIYYDNEIMGHFGIRSEDLVKEHWGYLFERTSDFSGRYRKSLFEQSIIKNGYDFLVEVMI